MFLIRLNGVTIPLQVIVGQPISGALLFEIRILEHLQDFVERLSNLAPVRQIHGETFVFIRTGKDVTIAKKNVRGELTMVRAWKNAVCFQLVRTDEDSVNHEGADRHAISVEAK